MGLTTLVKLAIFIGMMIIISIIGTIKMVTGWELTTQSLKSMIQSTRKTFIGELRMYAT